MEKNENSVELIKNLEMGRTYTIQLSSGALISGALAARYEYLTEDSVQKLYRIAFGNSKFVDIKEEEIESMELVKSHNTVLEYFKKFRENHVVNCFDDKGKLLSNSVILGKVMDKNVWDNLLEEEKKEFLEYLQLSKKDEVEIINVCMDYKDESEKFRKKRLDALDAVIEFLEKYNDVKNTYPGFEKMMRVLYKDLNIREWIDSI